MLSKLKLRTKRKKEKHVGPFTCPICLNKIEKYPTILRTKRITCFHCNVELYPNFRKSLSIFKLYVIFISLLAIPFQNHFKNFMQPYFVTGQFVELFFVMLAISSLLLLVMRLYLKKYLVFSIKNDGLQNEDHGWIIYKSLML
jgi:hypothetical protein